MLFAFAIFTFSPDIRSVVFALDGVTPLGTAIGGIGMASGQLCTVTFFFANMGPSNFQGKADHVAPGVPNISETVNRQGKH